MTGTVVPTCSSATWDPNDNDNDQDGQEVEETEFIQSDADADSTVFTAASTEPPCTTGNDSCSLRKKCKCWASYKGVRYWYYYTWGWYVGVSYPYDDCRGQCIKKLEAFMKSDSGDAKAFDERTGLDSCPAD